MQAGSERVKDTKASNDMLKEASNINRSLFTLGKVVACLFPCARCCFCLRLRYRTLMPSAGDCSYMLPVTCAQRPPLRPVCIEEVV